MAPRDPDLWERNRRLIAERLKWPDGALEVAESMEGMFPDYACWWGTGQSANPQPGFYAMRYDANWRHQQLYGRLPDELIATIEADMAKIARELEAFRKITRYSWQ